MKDPGDYIIFAYCKSVIISKKKKKKNYISLTYLRPYLSVYTFQPPASPLIIAIPIVSAQDSTKAEARTELALQGPLWGMPMKYKVAQIDLPFLEPSKSQAVSVPVKRGQEKEN